MTDAAPSRTFTIAPGAPGAGEVGHIIETAKKPETRACRVAKCVAMAAQ
ncbi:YdeI/OmpD-associated family protein [uncultured Sphingomonas sp.]